MIAIKNLKSLNNDNLNIINNENLDSDMEENIFNSRANKKFDFEN